MKLEVGMYVRTKYGIAKYIDDEVKSLNLIAVDRYIANEHMDGYENIIQPDEILKASHNIIDLIEVGDYINGCRVIAVNITEIVGHYSYVKCINDNVFKENEIETIVTKEQFSAMEYKLGGK